MKKVFFTLAIAALATSFTSCKKDYNCVCKVASPLFTIDVTVDAGKLSPSDAKATCDASAAEVNKDPKFVGTTTTCVATVK